MYEFANHAYVTTVATALLPAYFVAAVVPKGGLAVGSAMLSATTLWGYMVSAGALFVFLLAPVLGAVADRTGRRKGFLQAFCLAGSLFATLLVLCGPGDVALTMLLFSLAQICYVAGEVFNDSFLPLIAPAGALDRVSGKGFAFGYIGGGLHFALVLGLLTLAGRLGIGEGTAARIGMASAGLWWGGFALVTFARLRERPASPAATVATGLGRITEAFRALARRRDLLIFFVAFFLYNDGIQTVISMATVYGKEELGLSTVTLMLTLLAIQGVAFLGALAFGAMGQRLGAKPVLMAALVVWTGIVSYAYFIRTGAEFLILGLLVGTVLGGSQSLSRSMYAARIPKGETAQYFGYFSVMTKFSSILGPFLFATIRQATGSSRLAIISLAVFFLAGLAVLPFVPPAAEPERPAKRQLGAI
jgi:UMF1 family MFS transporter